MRRLRQSAVLSAVFLTAGAVLAACGGGGTDGGGSGGGGGSVTIGTTGTITALDPAGAYDLDSWNVISNIYQTLLVVPPGGGDPVPGAAKSCDYKTPKQLVCKLKPGQKFSNGHKLTSSDVKYTFDRMVKIADPEGPSVLFSNLKNVQTPDPMTAVFNLKEPDATFQLILTGAESAIVDEQAFPAGKLLKDDNVVGSGPYKLSQYKPGEQVVLQANKKYKGPKEPKTGNVFVRYYKEESTLKLAVQNGDVDVAYRNLSPQDINSLKKDDSVKVLQGSGAEIHYLVWYLKSGMGAKPAVRRAAAQIIDRKAVAQRAYDGTVEPLYSMVPDSFPSSVPAFTQEYGDSSVAKAKAILKKAGIKTPVPLTLGYNTDHYSANDLDMADELRSQLNRSGLFKVKTDTAEWTQYQTLYKKGKYDTYILGWFPDYLDPDDYISPFLVNGGFYQNGYKSATAEKLIAKERPIADRTSPKAQKVFKQLQKLIAKDIPVIPVWKGKSIAVTGTDVHGVEKTLDPTYILRFWMISKG
ncbi:MAG: ABC transporter substrate-binding protein [Streptosporangiales bacterium]